MEYIAPGEHRKDHQESYPCELIHHQGAGLVLIPSDSTAYGYVLHGTIDDSLTVVKQGHWFCLTGINNNSLTITCSESSNVVFIMRRGFKGQRSQGGPLEARGRLVYIDGCSDSLVVYPPRLGDPSLNYLYFPSGIAQTYHLHPSARYGIVIDGKGWADWKNSNGDNSQELIQGQAFYLASLEQHRFRTQDSCMKILAFHPDGDWGPQDHNHTMLNRTYLK